MYRQRLVRITGRRTEKRNDAPEILQIFNTTADKPSRANGYPVYPQKLKETVQTGFNAR